MSTVNVRKESTRDESQSRKPFYVTTPIFYVNASPHVGHMYTMVLADVFARWKDMQGCKTTLLTGTDEHGMKIQNAAEQAGLAPREFCDQGAEIFRDLAAKVNMRNDIFIRTTDPKHKEGVEYAWQILQEKGLIYENWHSGWYSVSDETFYPKNQVQLVIDPRSGRKIMASIETGKKVEWTRERNYHFRLSAFKEKLLQFYEENPGYLVPETRMTEVLKQVQAGLVDLSVSRPSKRLSWGVPVPNDPSQTIYVWVDALLNYVTAVGYPFTPGRESVSGWPADVQVIGKDILRFHCIYWPAFQMALDLPIHSRVLSHAHWTLGKQKMAKSTGNVVDPFFALERFGTDVMRWFLIHEGGIADDADYDNLFIIEKYKTILQARLGNLVSRVMRGKGWDVARAVKRYTTSPLETVDRSVLVEELDEVGHSTLGRIRALPSQVEKHMQNLLPNRALQAIMNSLSDINGYFQMRSPWSLVAEWRALSTFAESSVEVSAVSRSGSVPASAPFSTSHAKDVSSPAQELTQQTKYATLAAIEGDIDQTIFLASENLRLTGIMLQPFMPTKAKMLLDMLGVQGQRRDWSWCQLGADDAYGVPKVGLGLGEKGVLFPALSSDF